MSTTSSDVKALEREFTTEVLADATNLDAIDEYVADDYVGHNPGDQEDIHGPEELKAFTELLHSAFPDLELTVEDTIAEGNKVVQRTRLTGTHEGEFQGISPTGQSVEVTTVGITVWEDDKAVEHWAQIDMLGLLEQLGVT